MRRIIDFLLRLMFPLLMKTWRVRWKGSGDFWSRTIPTDVAPFVAGETSGAILFPHGDMFPIWSLFRNADATPVVSMSRDGERLVSLLTDGLGYTSTIRGSSSKGGKEVVTAMTTVLTRGGRILVTPDGPRGPARHVKPGGIVAAARAEAPILLLKVTCQRAIRLNSWDRMVVPLPGASIYIRYCVKTFQPISDSHQNREKITGQIDEANKFFADSNAVEPATSVRSQ